MGGKRGPVRLAVVGTGGMANAQIKAFRKVGGVEFVACCDIDRKRAKDFAKKHGIDAVYTDARELLAEIAPEAVTIVTSNRAHAPIALAALRQKIHVLCEKPLAMDTAEARKMHAAAKRSGVVHMVNFSYRNAPALEKARELVRSGALGRVLHVEASYLQCWLSSKIWGDWRKKPAFQWRQNVKAAGSGTLGDIGCHILDFATRAVGDIKELTCRLERFRKGVPGERIGGYKLDADDSVFVTARFKCGAVGTIHATRWATGYANRVSLRIFGDKGAVEVDLDRSRDSVRACTGKVARDHATWAEFPAKPRGTNMARFLEAVRRGGRHGGAAESPTFLDGLKVQAYLDACLASRGRPVKVRF